MRRVQPRVQVILRAAFPIVVVFLFAVFTGIPEMSFLRFLRPLRPIFAIGALGLVILAATGRFRKVVASPIGKVLVIFTFWFMLCVPLSIWRGGSFGVFVDTWSKSFLAYVLTAGLISTAVQEKKVFHTIGYSCGLLACIALAARNYDVEGRLSAGGRYSNANDLAWTLLIGLIFLGFLFLRGKRINKAVAILLMIPVLIAIAKTGSRTALLGAGMLFLYVFFQASASAKARLIIATPVLLFALLLVVPSQLRERYTTLFRTQSMTTAQVEASGSSAARLELLKDSITMTIMHPLVGVGPGNFMVAQQNLALARGEPFGLWHVTHNTYTELSSEMGIPGLVIYVIFLFQCWKTLAIILRRRGVSEEVLLMAQTLRAALVVLATVAFFDSYGYNANIPILAGLITALSFIAHSQRVANKIASKSVETAPSLPEPAFEPAWSGSPY